MNANVNEKGMLVALRLAANGAAFVHLPMLEHVRVELRNLLKSGFAFRAVHKITNFGGRFNLLAMAEQVIVVN